MSRSRSRDPHTRLPLARRAALTSPRHQLFDASRQQQQKRCAEEEEEEGEEGDDEEQPPRPPHTHRSSTGTPLCPGTPLRPRPGGAAPGPGERVRDPLSAGLSSPFALPESQRVIGSDAL